MNLLTRDPALTDSLTDAMAALDVFSGSDLTARISSLEQRLEGVSGRDCTGLLSEQKIRPELLAGAQEIKRRAGQINVVVHALGILLALPALLRPDEKIIALSLGAGNTGKPFDLETNFRVAEFKFITWQGGPEVIRQNALFKDFFELAAYKHPTNPEIERYLYVTGVDHPLKFLRSSRSLKSVMSRNSYLWEKFTARHQTRYITVGDYFASEGNRVHVEDISRFLPAALVGSEESLTPP